MVCKVYKYTLFETTELIVFYQTLMNFNDTNTEL